MRNRYLDLLRAAAIIRVIVYHLFGWPWLSIVLPAMGVMFALAGSLVAGSLDKREAEQVVASRLRRLLPPLWLLGALAVPVMLVAGWAHETDGEHPFSLARLALWLVPIADPPGSDKGIDVWEPLWYIRAYLWFIVLSPLMYRLYRRTGWLAVLAPFAVIGILDLTDFSLPDTADAVLWDFVTYAACWMAGFAHHDGRLHRLKAWVLVPVAVVLGATALWWLSGHQGEDRWDLNDVSESQALWSLAFVLLVLRWQPPMGWLARVKPLDSTVTLLNARAVTVYLWHNIAIAAVWPVLTVLALDDFGAEMEGVTEFAVALVLTLGAVLAFGWAEDLAARRRPRFWPTGSPALRTEPPPVTGRPPILTGATDPADSGPDSPAPAHPADSGPAAPVASGRLAALNRSASLGRSDPMGGGSGSLGTPSRRLTAAAAMNRLPANWPPLPAPADPPPADLTAADPTAADPTAADSADADPASAGHDVREPTVGELAVRNWNATDESASDRHSLGGNSHDLGLPVAGRRADPVDAVDPDDATAAPDWFRDRRTGETPD